MFCQDDPLIVGYLAYGEGIRPRRPPVESQHASPSTHRTGFTPELPQRNRSIVSNMSFVGPQPRIPRTMLVRARRRCHLSSHTSEMCHNSTRSVPCLGASPIRGAKERAPQQSELFCRFRRLSARCTGAADPGAAASAFPGLDRVVDRLPCPASRRGPCWNTSSIVGCCTGSGSLLRCMICITRIRRGSWERRPG